MSSLVVANSSGGTQYSKTNLAVPVILDSGTTLTYLPDQYANDIIGGVGAINDKNYGYVVPCSLGGDGATFTFQFGGASGPSIVVGMSEFVLPIVTQSSGPAPTAADGSALCQFGINPAGNSPNLFGDTFLRSAYVVYDLENEQIGLANTNFNATSSNIKEFSDSTIPGASAAPSNAVVVTQTFSGHLLATTAQAATGTGTITGPATGTFVLGSSTAKSTAMRTFGSPKVDMAMVVVGCVGVASFVFGTSLVLLL